MNMYQSYYPNPMFNNYQFQQPQQPMPMQQANIPGRIVNTFDEITANEIPMDGKIATFIKTDLSEIVLKKWESNGTISNLRFKAFEEPIIGNLSPESQNEQIKANFDVLEQIMNDIQSLNEKIDRMSRSKAKKDVIIDAE